MRYYTTSRNKHDGLDCDKKVSISLMTDQLARFNAGTEAVLYHDPGVTLCIQRLTMMDPCRKARLIPRVGLICPPDGLDEESALDFPIKVTFADQVSFFSGQIGRAHV